MKKNIYLTIILLAISISLGSLTISKYTAAQTVNNDSVHITPLTPDDPGAGRLSGDNIPDEFYDEYFDNSIPFLKRYGSSQSKSPYTNKTYTHKDAFDGLTISHGIDVSYYQKNIDWNKVKADGIDFAFIRVGYRGYGKTGTLAEDTDFSKNIDGAAAAGLRTGIYIFSQAITENEAIEEAQFILNRIGTHQVNMPLILDYEFAGNPGRLGGAKLTKAAATKICLAFCKTIYDAGYTPMVYANPDMLNNHLNPDDISPYYPIWLANYTTSTKYTGTFSYWQYASTGSVNGISGNVDMNFYYVPKDNDISTSVIPPIATQKYTGVPVTPEPAIKVGDTILTKNRDYTLTYSNNIEVGTASVTITGIGKYFGTKTLKFNIESVSPLPIIKGLSTKKKSTKYITLSWNKASNITGYQIYRSDTMYGSYKKIKTISKASTTSYKNTKLSAGVCYYYKIRAYKKNDSGTQYGDFSTVTALCTNTGYTRLALAKKGAAIYKDIDTSSEVIATPAENTSMKVTYQTKDAAGNIWYLVTYKGSKGYMRSNQVTIAKQGKTTRKNVNVRKKASTKSKKVTTLKKKTKVIVLKTKKVKRVTWYNVMFTKSGKTYKAWISAPYVKII